MKTKLVSKFKMLSSNKSFYLLVGLLLLANQSTFAGTQPILVSGTVNLVQQVAGWLTLLIPSAGGAVLGFHALGKMMASDEAVSADKDKKMKTVLKATAIAWTAPALITFFLTFYTAG